MRTFSRSISDLLIAWRIPLLLLGVAAAVAAYFPSQDLVFDRSIENMFAPDDPLLEPYAKLKRTFGGNEIVLAVYVDEDLLHPDGRGIARTAVLSAELKAVPGVKDVISLDQPRGLDIVRPNDPLSERLRDLLQGYTHGADGKTAAVVCMLVPEAETDVPREALIEQLRSIIHRRPSGMIAGEPVMVADGFRYIEEDGRRLGWMSTLLLGAVIIFCFRSLRWVIVPLAVVQLTLLLTQATLVVLNMQLSMVSSMLTAIVTVVGIATVIHVIVRFREARDDGLSPREALSHTGGILVIPIVLTCSTDAVGFASLQVAAVGPVQDFGVMMAVGSLLAIVSVALVLPGLALLGRRDPDPRRPWGENFLDAGLQRIVRLVRQRPKSVGLTTLVLGGVAIVGMYRLEVETDFTKNFRATSPIVQSYEFVETHLGGAGVWDVVLPAPATLDWKYLRRVRHLEDRLRSEVLVPGPEDSSVPGLTKVLSMADAVLANSPKDPESVRSTLWRNTMVSVALKKTKEKIPVLEEALHGEDPEQPGRHYLRIMLRARERQPASHKRMLIEQVRRISSEEFPPDSEHPDDQSGAEVTGFFVLLANLISSMVRDQRLTFSVATAGIALMMGLALRRPVLVVVAMVPNLLPIAMVTGLMGWSGLKINMGAAMIAAVSMGLSIDSSIHYLLSFRRARDEGHSVQEALDIVQRTVGRAMVFSTLALVVGFMVLCTSQFVPVIYFGVLVSLSMAGGLAGNLVVLPLLLSLVTREEKA